MRKPSTQIGKYNDLKATFLEAKASRASHDHSAGNDFYDWAKVHSPDTYQRSVHQEARSAQMDASMEALLDDPQTIAEWDELAVLFDNVKQQHGSAERQMLGIEAGATKREIYNAYRRKARKLHPDAGGDEAAFKRLHAAYRRLLAAAPA